MTATTTEPGTIAGNGIGHLVRQMSDALGMDEPGQRFAPMPASFTFRGEMNDLRNATATFWAGGERLTWRGPAPPDHSHVRRLAL